MKKIPLSRGYHATVDDEDYILLSTHRWSAESDFNKDGSLKNIYAVRKMRINGKLKRIWMHREICRPASGRVVDHIDGNGLNNSRKNLRECTSSQNQHNQPAQSRKKSSAFKGVYWHIKDKKWIARIKVGGIRRHIGSYSSENDAALAYDAAARELHGDFAKANMPLPVSF